MPQVRRLARVRVQTLLSMLVAVPLLSVGWLSSSAVVEARQQVRQGERLTMQSENVRALSTMASSLVAEASWGGTSAALRDFGIPTRLVSRVVGIDIATEYAAAVEASDLSTEAVADDELLAAIDEARTKVEDGEPWEVGQAYRTVMELADSQILAQVDELSELVDSSSGGAEVGVSMRVLAETVELRRYSSDITLGSFSARYQNLAEPGRAVFDLMSGIAGREATVTNLGRLVQPGTGVHAAWHDFNTDPAIMGFLERARDDFELISDQGAGAVRQQPTELNLRAEQANFEASLTVVELHARLVDTAVDDMVWATNRMGADADRDRRNAIQDALLAAAAAILAVLYAGRSLVQPLRSLSTAAARMRSGNLDAHAEEHGPTEVRDAAMALNEAAEQLRLAELQAVALAGEDLDNPALGQAAPGLLGQSLQEAVAGLAQSLTEREEYRRRLVHEATHDNLTGLPNRASIFVRLEEGLARSRRSGSSLAVFFIDLDGFKQVNDTAGHAVGDKMLIMAAERIADAIRDGDVVGRIGGDEFVVVAEPVDDINDAVAVADRILTALCQPAPIDGKAYPAGASIGVALAGPEGLTADEVVRDADLAVYQAKELGRNRYEICDVDLREEVARRQATEQLLRHAVRHNKLDLCYRTVAEDGNKRPIGLEARATWRYRPGTALHPTEVHRLAKRCNLIGEIERWIFEQVCEQLAKWTDDPTLGRLPIAVQLSHEALTSATVVSDLVAVTSAAGVNPNRLVVEVDEGDLFANLDVLRPRIGELREKGFGISIDGFGRQIGALWKLKTLDIDRIGVDPGALTNDALGADESLLSTLQQIGRLLGVVVAISGGLGVDAGTSDQAGGLLASEIEMAIGAGGATTDS